MFRYSSDQSLLLDVSPSGVDLGELGRIPGVVNLHPGYASVLIVFDPLRTTHADVERAAAGAIGGARRAGVEHRIAVRYDGPDLEAVARLHGMSPERVVELHTGASYEVAFLGFVPGFAYLTGLPEALRTPRLAEPRKLVPAGSVGIAGGQTAVYPLATPGGWRLIGRTEAAMFDAERERMSLLDPGDRVRFVAV
jgi:KipI family sensor histidine kinase inhibitor